MPQVRAHLGEIGDAMRELLLGCGDRRDKDLWIGDDPEWHDVFTVDIFEDHHPDLVYDISNLPLPFEDDEFDEIHAYDVLEHLASQGDYRHFFAEFNEYHRILKPGGFLMASVPWWKGRWAWGDPGHTRVIMPETLSFLTPHHYLQVGRTKSSDYRPLITGYWDAVHLNIERAPGEEKTEGSFQFVLRALTDAEVLELTTEPTDEPPVEEASQETHS